MYTILKDTPLEITVRHPFQILAGVIRENQELERFNFSLYFNPTSIWSENAKNPALNIEYRLNTTCPMYLEVIPKRQAFNSEIYKTDELLSILEKPDPQFTNVFCHGINFTKSLDALNQKLIGAYESGNNPVRLIKAICKLIRRLHAKPKDMRTIAQFVQDSYETATSTQKKSIREVLQNEFIYFIDKINPNSTDVVDCDKKASIIYQWLKIKPLPITIAPKAELTTKNVIINTDSLRVPVSYFLLNQDKQSFYLTCDNLSHYLPDIRLLNHNELVTVSYGPCSSENTRQLFENHLRNYWESELYRSLPEYLVPIAKEL